MWSHVCREKLNHDAVQSKTIPDFVRIVSHDGQLPSLHYQSLANLVIHFLPIDGKKLIKDYEKKIKQCLKSQVSRGVQQLKVKVNFSYDKYLKGHDDEVLDLKITLGKLFKFPPEEVVLLSVKEGSIELTYLVPSWIATNIKAWNFKEESDVLQQASIESISIEG